MTAFLYVIGGLIATLATWRLGGFVWAAIPFGVWLCGLAGTLEVTDRRR